MRTLATPSPLSQVSNFRHGGSRTDCHELRHRAQRVPKDAQHSCYVPRLRYVSLWG